MKHYLFSNNQTYLVDNDPILDNLAGNIDHARELGDATFHLNEYRSYVEICYLERWLLDDFKYEAAE